jgi:stress response protein YsnF
MKGRASHSSASYFKKREGNVMTLSELSNFNDADPLADVKSIHNFDVYEARNEKVGQVVAASVDRADHSPYLIIKIGSWLASRQVLLPLRSYRVNLEAQRIDIDGWSKEEIDQLPTHPKQAQVEDVSTPLETSASLESGAELEAPIAREIYLITAPLETSPLLQKVPMLAPVISEEIPLSETSAEILDEKIIPLLEERLIIDRHKRKSGEIVIRKVIETEVIEVVVRREKLIVEQVSPEYKELAVIDLGRTSSKDTSPS